MSAFLKIIIALIVILGIYFSWNIAGPVVSAPKEKYFYVTTGSNFEEVKSALVERKVISNTFFFEWISKLLNYPSHIKPGRYEFTNGSNLISLVRKLKSGNQKAVRLVLTKLRTKEDFAKKIGENFETDSLEAIKFLLSNDSLAPYHLDTNTVMSIIIPNSYLLWWNGSFSKIFKRLKTQHDYFWEGKRVEKAKRLGMSPEAIYTLASIVEEETNMEKDKPKVSSVYINRLKKGMKLEADPTVKYAMRQFELKRILNGHLSYSSPYNTYTQKGLPPGPICTPSINTIDAVLDVPETDYIFFVAKPDFSGYSNFSNNYNEHLKYAKLYQQALDKLLTVSSK